jgi:hypothetical protein
VLHVTVNNAFVAIYVASHNKTYLDLLVKRSVFLSGFIQIWAFLTDFSKSLQYPVYPFSGSVADKCERRDERKLISVFCDSMQKRQKWVRFVRCLIVRKMLQLLLPKHHSWELLSSLQWLSVVCIIPCWINWLCQREECVHFQTTNNCQRYTISTQTTPVFTPFCICCVSQHNPRWSSWKCSFWSWDEFFFFLFGYLYVTCFGAVRAE